MNILLALAYLKQAFAADPALNGLDKPDQQTQIVDLPNIVAYLPLGAFGPGSLDEDRFGVFTIGVDVRVARTDLAEAFDELMGTWLAAVNRVIHEAARTRFGGHVLMLGDHMAGPEQRPITFEIAPDEWVRHLNILLAYRIVVTTQEGATDE